MSDPRFKSEYGISRLIRYHGKRQRFFDGLHRIVLFTNAVLGSSAFVTIISDRTYIAAWLTAIVAIISALDNVVAFSERARKHSEQRSRYYELYCELIATPTAEFKIDAFREKRLRIDRDSPPPRRVLDVIARNEEDIARGFAHAETSYVSWPRYLLRHLIDLPPKRWETVAEVNARRNPRAIKKEEALEDQAGGAA
ncbi:MAG TPA: hypothetical protein VEZ70_02300 [Allosphingosinicella sp.]|nr:hypothetical protein [Allosphingosinicella sp.]